MKIKRIASILMTGLISLSCIGCNVGGKETDVRVNKEEAFTTIPEEKLVTPYIQNMLSKDTTFLKDGEDFLNLYFFDVENTDTTNLINKYKLDYKKGTTYNSKDLVQQYKDLYEVGVNSYYTNIHVSEETGEVFVNEKLAKQIENYLADVWMNENVQENSYILSEEFSALNPKETFQKYLKTNKIEITKFTYPEQIYGFNYVSGADVVTVKVNVKGTQNKKAFEKNIALDFYFVPNTEIRNGETVSKEIKDTDFEIMAVSKGTVAADDFDTIFTYDINAAKQSFGIK